MKLDWDVIRKMLIKTESDHSLPLSMDGIDQLIVAYHRRMLCQSPLIYYGNLTERGQNLLCHIRCDARWSKIKACAEKKDIGLTEDFIPIISSALST